MSGYDALLVDLDGTVYRGREAIDGAVDALEAARAGGTAVAYVTNNASRGPQAVADHLAELGLTVTADDVVTSAQAAAAVLAEQYPAGSRVLVLGTEALEDEIRAVGLEPVRRAEDDPAAVVQGHSPETGWPELAEATMAIAAGATWVACNVDRTLPSERGLLPGNGAMVAALGAASGRDPEVAGKPAAPLLAQSAERVSSRRPLVVGDRLDTDIAGAHAVEADSLMVLTGVSTPAQLLTSPPDRRPTYVAADLRVLADLGDLDAARVEGAGADGDWTVERGSGEVLVLSGKGDTTAALRALCAVAWAGGGDVEGDVDGGVDGGITVRADGEDAEAAVTALGLPRA